MHYAHTNLYDTLFHRLYAMHCVLHATHYTLHTTHYVLHTIHYALTMHSLCTTHYALHTHAHANLHNTPSHRLHTMHDTLCATHYTLHTRCTIGPPIGWTLYTIHHARTILYAQTHTYTQIRYVVGVNRGHPDTWRLHVRPRLRVCRGGVPARAAFAECGRAARRCVAARWGSAPRRWS